MSTFMGAAWLDVADVNGVLEALRGGAGPSRLQAWHGASRIELYSDDEGYEQLGDLVAAVMRRTGLVRRAVVFLDHDEYGAEHVVVAPDGAGGVCRLHHVYVFPDDDDSEGDPAMTDLPPAAGAGPGGRPGALIDDAAARDLTARLFGVPVGRLHAAADAAADAHEGLGVVGEPARPWLEALGIGWVGAAGGVPVNLRPGSIWRDAVARAVAPRLPGEWLARDYDLVRLPATPLMCAVLPGRHSGDAVVWPLYVPDVHGTLQYAVTLSHAVADTEPDADRLVGELVEKALPFFDRHGTLEGLWALCQDRTNPHDVRCRAATEVMLGRPEQAAATYEGLARSLAGNQPEWARDLAEEARVRSVLLRHDPAVVREALLETVRAQATRLGVPENA